MSSETSSLDKRFKDVYSVWYHRPRGVIDSQGQDYLQGGFAFLPFAALLGTSLGIPALKSFGDATGKWIGRKVFGKGLLRSGAGLLRSGERRMPCVGQGLLRSGGAMKDTSPLPELTVQADGGGARESDFPLPAIKYNTHIISANPYALQMSRGSPASKYGGFSEKVVVDAIKRNKSTLLEILPQAKTVKEFAEKAAKVVRKDIKKTKN